MITLGVFGKNKKTWPNYVPDFSHQLLGLSQRISCFRRFSHPAHYLRLPSIQKSLESAIYLTLIHSLRYCYSLYLDDEERKFQDL